LQRPKAMFATIQPIVATKSSLERATRIELAFSAWEADSVLRASESKVLIARQFQRVLFNLHFRWAPRGHYPKE